MMAERPCRWTNQPVKPFGAEIHVHAQLSLECQIFQRVKNAMGLMQYLMLTPTTLKMTEWI